MRKETIRKKILQKYPECLFGQSFNDWVGEKRRILTDDKENFLKTLAEEAGNKKAKIIIMRIDIIIQYNQS